MKKHFTHMAGIHGWLVVAKPEGPTSFDVIRRVRKALPKVKCGHGGTLDPLASGVLPLAFGEATKVISYMMNLKKTYRFRVTWGEQRETDDREGNVIATSCERPTLKAIQAILPQFQGLIKQTPPSYSAVKIAGKRACDRMRNAEEITLLARLVYIERLELVGCPDEHNADFEVICHKGTYVRSLARDMAQALGTVGYAATIHRVSVGHFHEENAFPFERLAIEPQMGVLEDYIQPLDTVLDDILAVQSDSLAEQRLRQGQSIALNATHVCRGVPEESKPLVVYGNNAIPIAMAELREGQIWPKRVFNIKQ